MKRPVFFVIMGVCGSGKSSIAEMLANKLGVVFFECDLFHSLMSLWKMHQKIPLNDMDRWPWLDAINLRLKECQSVGVGVVFSCSALRRAYRERLSEGIPNLQFVYPKGTFETIKERLNRREGHFMPPELLLSQFETLEEPNGAESNVLTFPTYSNQ